MENVRFYGKGPYPLAVIHGGPGALGEMAPVARHLSNILSCGVLEPLQTKLTVNDQILELKNILE